MTETKIQEAHQSYIKLYESLKTRSRHVSQCWHFLNSSFIIFSRQTTAKIKAPRKVTPLCASLCNYSEHHKIILPKMVPKSKQFSMLYSSAKWGWALYELPASECVLHKFQLAGNPCYYTGFSKKFLFLRQNGEQELESVSRPRLNETFKHIHERCRFLFHGNALASPTTTKRDSFC